MPLSQPFTSPFFPSGSFCPLGSIPEAPWASRLLEQVRQEEREPIFLPDTFDASEELGMDHPKLMCYRRAL